ncbi:MAG: ATP-binding protein [Methylobacter sp.]
MAVSSLRQIIEQEELQIGDKLNRPSTCETHGDYTENGHVFFGGKVIWSGCQICSKIRADEEEKFRLEMESQAKQKKIEKRLNQAGVPLRFRERNFDNFIASNSGQESAFAIAEAFAKNFEDHLKAGSSLIFSGKAGTGKTHLALSIAQYIMPKHTAMYINAMDAVRMVRDTWRKNSEKSETDVLDMLGSIDLLVIDEVGVQNGTENEQVLLFDIINRRYRDMRPTILLTNLGTSGFSEFITERSFDRLKENGTWVKFDWESYRGRRGA